MIVSGINCPAQHKSPPMSMEAKASQLSQRSGTQAPKMSKTPSKASITPSQMSERTRLNMANQNRDPLDALSRMTQRQMAERRSGLQDVDDDYLKNVVYAYAGRTKNAAAQRNEVRADMIPAGVPTLRTPHRPGQRVAAGAEQTGQETSARSQQSADATAAAQVAQEKIMANQPPQSPDAAAQQPQSNAVAPSSPQAAGTPDPEMYTTCPNCRATLYLVRNIGDPSPYGTQPTQQQQQAGQTQAAQQPAQSQPQEQQQKQSQPPAQQGTPAPAAVPVQQ